MIIAVDFDGTIVEHKYPAIGKEIPFATASLRQLMQDGHKLILWSVREGQLLDDAVKWCEERGVRFYAVNSDIDEDASDHQGTAHFSRKIKADVFIDDRTIYQMVTKHMSYAQYVERLTNNNQEPKKKAWWKF